MSSVEADVGVTDLHIAIKCSKVPGNSELVRAGQNNNVALEKGPLNLAKGQQLKRKKKRDRDGKEEDRDVLHYVQSIDEVKKRARIKVITANLLGVESYQDGEQEEQAAQQLIDGWAEEEEPKVPDRPCRGA